MHGQLTRHEAPSAQAARILRAFRHVSWVRIDQAAGRALVVGIRHRLPVSLEVPVAVAAELQRRGVRTVVRGVA